MRAVSSGHWLLPLSVLTWTVQMAVFHGVGLAFEWADRTGALASFKVRRSERRSYLELLPRVLFNQVFVLLPTMVVFQLAGLAFTGAPHLTVLHFLVAMALMSVGFDIVQYGFHRWVLHAPRLMHTLGHNVHHSTGTAKAISAIYMSQSDFFLEIVLPYLVPLALVGAGAAIVFHLTVASLGAIVGLYEHSGYDFAARLQTDKARGLRGRARRFFALLITSKAHREHHRVGNVSYSEGVGSLGICDTIFKTRWDLASPPKGNSASR